MEYKDYYKILGVEKTATQDEIKSSFRKLARKFHPDINKEDGAEEEFKKINEANEVLKDPEKRAAYDELGMNWEQGQDFKPDQNWDAGFEFSGGFKDGGGGFEAGGGGQYSDFFENIFGKAYQQQREQQAQERFNAKGQDSHAKVLIDLEDSFTGTKRMISLKVPTLTEDGHVTIKDRQLNITIPKGVHEGQHIRLKGQGQPSLGTGGAGDLYLEIAFKPHAFYHIEGNDLSFHLPLTPWEAALGATIKVPTPTGQVDLKVPKSAKQGQKLRMKGRGIPAKIAGNLYVIFDIALPPADSDKAKALYETMAKELNFNPRSHLGV